MKRNRIAASLLAAILLVGLLTACTAQDPKKGTNVSPTLPAIDAPTGGTNGVSTDSQTPTMPTVTLPSDSTGTAPTDPDETDPKEGETQTTTSAPETQPQLQPTQGSSNTPAPSTTEPTETQKPVVASNDTNEDLKEQDEDSEEDLP